MRLGVLVSGSGSNLGALIERVHGRSATIAGVCSSNGDAFALERARAAGIESAVFPLDAHAGDTSRRDGAMADWLDDRGVELVVCAGFMGVLTSGFLARFPSHVLNLHPSLLPAFPGAHAIDDALAAGVTETGVTVHLVDEVLDGGPIVAQARVPVDYDETPEGLRARIHAAEHQLLPAVVEDVARGALDLDDIARKART
ncbi:MAG: phosphoribosylglycinamide formyltransferase 1 [Gaiellales bacterium]|jgi:phosphoribosylglycinamide formyltransferase-1|nr:phosphoribosylglycinamide formyltransferase 1 [Gaiellales bacterium]MDX6597241.1 phosphoribosylglycinamide formyltransferase 1 [Gaiellales bacterium]